MENCMDKMIDSLDETIDSVVAKRDKALSEWVSDLSNSEKFQVQMEYKTVVRQWLTSVQR
jgi:hypothetical protein